MARRTPYAPLAEFAAPVTAGPVWRVVLGTALVALSYVVAQMVVGALVMPAQGSDTALPGPLTRLQIAAYLGTFALPLAVLLRWTTWRHHRPGASLFGPRALAIAQFRRALGALILLAAALTILPPWLQATDYLRLNPLGPWLLWFAPMALAVLIQSTAEEALFRGYLMQELAARSRSPMMWMLAPSLLFGLLHLPNGTSPAEAAMFGLWIGAFALMAADLTARAGSLGPAIAFHWANNLQSLLINGEAGSPFEAAALIVWPSNDAALAGLTVSDVFSPVGLFSVGFGLLPVVVAWLAIRLAIRR